MKVFVSGASAERTMIKSFMDSLRAVGVEITVDWIKAIEDEGTANTGLTAAKMLHYAQMDLRGVDDADVVWTLIPNNNSKGCWVELGYAFGKGKLIVTSGNEEASIFTAMSHAHFKTHGEALAAVIEKHHQRRSLEALSTNG
jgi:nucleoside 2-deoxyribosyltransferase